ncbi:MAG: hypothetical protein WA477_25580, partial [Candidatus Sulfotelmatobacter sp.]
MHKRNGLGRIGLALMMSATMILAGCSTDWVQEAEQIVAVMIPGAANLVTLIAMLEGKTVTAEDLAVVQSAGTQAGSDLQLIQSLIAAYDKADATAKPGILSQIQSALNAAQANLAGLLPALHIKDAATQTKLTAVVGILLSEVQSLAAVVPVVQASGAKGQESVAARLSTASEAAVGNAGGKGKVPLSARE